MQPGQRFSFVISADIAGRMDRVVMINDGRIVAKNGAGNDVIYTVERS